MVDQPGMRDTRYKQVGKLPFSKIIKERTFFIECFPGIGEEREYQVKMIAKFLDEFF